MTNQANSSDELQRILRGATGIALAVCTLGALAITSSAKAALVVDPSSCGASTLNNAPVSGNCAVDPRSVGSDQRMAQTLFPSPQAGPNETAGPSVIDPGDTAQLDEISVALAWDPVRNGDAETISYAVGENLLIFTDIGSDNGGTQIATTLPFTTETAWDADLRAEMSRSALLGLNKRGIKAGYSLASFTSYEIFGFLAFTAISPAGFLLLRRRKAVSQRRRVRRRG